MKNMKRDVLTVWLASAFALLLLAAVVLFIDAPSPTTRVLRQKLSGVTEVRILSSHFFDASPIPILVLKDKTAQDFANALELNEKADGCYGTCACNGTHEFRFYKGSAMIGSFYFKDRGALHSNDGFWKGDLPMSTASKQYLQTTLKQ